MQQVTVVSTKIAPPRRHAHLSRGCLVGRLRDVLGGRLALICANAGYGKTTLLAQFLREVAPRAAIYRLEKSDRDPIVFLTYLSADLEPLCPEGSREVKGAALGFAGAAPDPHQLLALLLEKCLQRVSGDTVLALDDYHRVDTSEEINGLVEQLIELSPPNLHFVIATRTHPRLPLHRWQAEGELIELSKIDLAFTLAEVKALFRDLYRRDISDSLLEALHSKTEGWAAGLALVHHCLNGRGEQETFDFLEHLDGSTISVYDYLAEEVFRQQPEEIKGFLCATSLLSRLSGDLCDQLLERSDSEEVLRYLERNGLFTFGLDGQGYWYRYHRLFKTFLQRQLRRRMGETATAALRERLAELLVHQGDPAQAIAHYCRAGNYSRAAEVVLAEAETLLALGHLDTLLHRLRQIPRAFGASQPWLLHYEALVLRLQDDPGAAWPLQQEALRRFRERGDVRGEARSLLQVGLLCHQMGRARDGIAALEEALERRPPEEPLLHARILAGLVRTHVAVSRFRRAVALGEEALGLLAGLEDGPMVVRCRAQVLQDAAWAYMHMGEVSSAIEAASEADRLLRAQGGDERALAGNLHTLGVVLGARSGPKAAIDLLEEARRLARKHQMDSLTRNIEAALAGVCYGSGDLETAESHYDRAANPAAGYANAGFYYFLRVFCHLSQRRRDEAMRMAREALKVAEAGGSAGDLGTAYTLLGVVHREERDYEQAALFLEEAEKILAAVEFLYRVASVRVHLARLCFVTGQQARGEQLLREALGFARDKGFFQFAYWHPDTVAYVLARALEAGIEVDYAESLFLKRLGGRECRHLLPLLSRPDLAERVGTIIGKLSARPLETTEVAREVVADCPDDAVREHITNALIAEDLSLQGLARLRNGHQLTWREIDVFIHYYLRDHGEGESSGFRRQRAAEMAISEKTLKCHVASIRRKLGVHTRVGAINRADWREH